MTVRSLILAASSAAIIGFAGAPAFASDIDDTRIHQQERIRQGIRSGQLTRHEAEALEREQARIDGMIRRARLDGHMSLAERREIEHAQDEASRHIFREKHDAEVRPTRRWSWWHRTSFY